MDSNNQPLDSFQMEGNIIPSKKIIRSAGTGIISIVIAILLLMGMANMNEESALVVLIPIFLVLFGLIIPIWMLIRSVLFLVNKRNVGVSKRTLAISLTVFLGFILLLLFITLILYIRADKTPPF